MYNDIQYTSICFICGKYIPPDMTQIIVKIGKGSYASCCCSHEGSEEVEKYIQENEFKEVEEND